MTPNAKAAYRIVSVVSMVAAVGCGAYGYHDGFLIFALVAVINAIWGIE